MKLIGELDTIDIMLVPIGDNFTMGIDDAVKAVEFVQPGLAVPMHYNTFPVIQANPLEFVEKCQSKGMNARAMKFGETMSF
jgi:L-ascorbate metabolism protein UlaG (beta-lactamase superfamily)